VIIGKRYLSLLLTSFLLISILAVTFTTEGSAYSTKAYWPMTGGDQSHASASSINVTEKAPTCLWDIQPTGSSMTSKGYYVTATTPVIGPDGALYVASEAGNVSEINPNGTVKWTEHIGDSPSFSPAISPNGSLIVAAEIGSNGTSSAFYSFSSNGSLIWKLVLDEGNPYSMNIGPDGTIYSSLTKNIQAADGNWTRENVIAIAINRNGTVKWKIDLPKDWTTTPVISSDGKVYLLTGSNLYAISDDGTLNWTYPIRDSTPYDISQASVTKEGSIEFVCDSGFYRINSNGTLTWKVDIFQQSQSADLIYDGHTDRTYVLTADQLAAYDMNGTNLWQTSLNGIGITLYQPVLSGNGQILICTGSDLISYNSTDGFVLWKSEIPSATSLESGPSGISIGPSGTIYFTLDNNQTGSLHLYAFNSIQNQITAENLTNTDNTSTWLAISAFVVVITVLLAYLAWRIKKR
jgi:DNA-binding beta-propeller fold protein YncE